MPVDGDLFRGADTPQVYFMDVGQRHWVPDPETLLSRWTWEQVQVLPQVDVDAVPLGSQLPHVARIQVGDVQTDLGAGHFMNTSATLLTTGRLDATTRTRSVTWFGGFTGGVTLGIVDPNGVVFGATSVHKFGVDGRGIGTSDRLDHWTEMIDPVIAGRAGSLAVLHAWTPKVNMEQMVRNAIAIGELIFDLIKKLEKTKSAGGGQ